MVLKRPARLGLYFGVLRLELVPSLTFIVSVLFIYREESKLPTYALLMLPCSFRSSFYL